MTSDDRFLSTSYLPAYGDNDIDSVLAHNTFQSELHIITEKLSAIMMTPSFEENRDYSVYTGSERNTCFNSNCHTVIANICQLSFSLGTAGIAYVFWRLSRNRTLLESPRFGSTKIQQWRRYAMQAIHSSLDAVKREIQNESEKRKGRCSTMLTGHVGVYALAAAIYLRDGNAEKSSYYRNLVLRLTPSIVTDDNTPCEILYGFSGYLSCLLFMQAHANLHFDNSLRTLIKKILKHIVVQGYTFARNIKSDFPLMWQWHGKMYLGAAHGICGILTVLLNFHVEIVEMGYDNIVKRTLDKLLSLRFSSGNLPSSIGSQSDKLVHWCHGASGLVPLLCVAISAYPRDRKNYEKILVETVDVILERGLLKKGFGICHGISGNAFALLCASRSYKSKAKYHSQAVRFALFACKPLCKNANKIKTELLSTPDRPYSLMEGLSGLVCLLSYLVNESNDIALNFINDGCPWLM